MVEPIQPSREELEDSIARYRALFWGTDDQPTRDALRARLKELEHALEERETSLIVRLQQDAIDRRS